VYLCLSSLHGIWAIGAGTQLGLAACLAENLVAAAFVAAGRELTETSQATTCLCGKKNQGDLCDYGACEHPVWS
jgi:hypothetical protein